MRQSNPGKRRIRTLICVLLIALSGDVALADGANDFDFLLGSWQIELTPKVSSLAVLIHGQPKLRGSWKAWRGLDGRGVIDELRVVDGSGNPKSYSHSLRLYDPDTRQWLISTLDVYRARLSQLSAETVAGSMQIAGSGTAHDGSEYLSRNRFSEISGDHFRMQQDRSYDGGASWEEAVLVIEADRIGADAAP